MSRSARLPMAAIYENMDWQRFKKLEELGWQAECWAVEKVVGEYLLGGYDWDEYNAKVEELKAARFDRLCQRAYKKAAHNGTKTYGYCPPKKVLTGTPKV